MNEFHGVTAVYGLPEHGLFAHGCCSAPPPAPCARIHSVLSISSRAVAVSISGAVFFLWGGIPWHAFSSAALPHRTPSVCVPFCPVCLRPTARGGMLVGRCSLYCCTVNICLRTKTGGIIFRVAPVFGLAQAVERSSYDWTVSLMDSPPQPSFLQIGLFCIAFSYPEPTKAEEPKQSV